MNFTSNRMVAATATPLRVAGVKSHVEEASIAALANGSRPSIARLARTVPSRLTVMMRMTTASPDASDGYRTSALDAICGGMMVASFTAAGAVVWAFVSRLSVAVATAISIDPSRAMARNSAMKRTWQLVMAA